MIALLCAMVAGGAFAGGGTQSQSGQVSADNFPSKPVTAMVAWAAGGGADVIFRALAEVFPKYANGQPLLVVNKGEAAGVPGIMDFKQNAKPDGYDVMHWNTAHVIKTHMDPVPFTATEFAAVCKVVEVYCYVLVPANAKWQNLQDFIADAKANPGQISMGNAGAGCGHHLGALLLEKAAGIRLKHVPFAGGGPAVTGLLTGDCQSSCNVPPEGIPQMEAGQLRLLANYSPNRLEDFPDVPTLKELGVDLVYSQWRGVVAPAGTPEPIVRKLESIFKQCAEDPTFIGKMRNLKTVISFQDSKTYAATIAREDKEFEQLLREGKIGNKYK